MRKIPNSELDRLSINEFKSAAKESLIVVLDNIRSLNNIGSVFRTSDAYMVQSVYLCGITAKPPHREIHKTALGATESVDWQHFNSITDAIQSLKNMGYKIYAIEQMEEDKIAIILGTEINGVSDEALPLTAASIELPQYGTKHSLNISVCAGIVIWHLFPKKAT